MFNWIKRNLGDPLQVSESTIEATQKPLPLPAPPEGVSEPVLSFIKLVKEHPENFLFRRCRKRYGRYILIDKLNRQRYDCFVNGRDFGISELNFLTREEIHLLRDLFFEAKENYKKSEERKQRQKYVDIYCKDRT